MEHVHHKRRSLALPPVRVSENGLRWVDEVRRRHDVSRSDVIREALALAARHSDEFDRRLAKIKAPREF